MKMILATALTLTLLAAGAVSARPMMHHHMHKVCTMHHHHKVCRMVP
jgi:hypothetical protein